ncbi:MAG: hypothetical protein ACI4D7_11205 [Lachnospiraceae bacterium]
MKRSMLFFSLLVAASLSGCSHGNKPLESTEIVKPTQETKVQETTEIPAESSSEKAISEDGWKQAYIDYINGNRNTTDTLSGSDMEIYKLVDINGDQIPELYINFGTTAGGDIISTFYNGTIVEQTIWNYGFSYIEGQNLFRDSGGHMDEYYDRIYDIEDGTFVLLHEGEYGAADNASVQFDSNGEPIYQYTWDKKDVSSKEEYQNLLQAVYDTDQAVSPFDGAEYDSKAGRYVGNGLCDYQEIIDAINSY